LPLTKFEPLRPVILRLPVCCVNHSGTPPLTRFAESSNSYINDDEDRILILDAMLKIEKIIFYCTETESINLDTQLYDE
jgi:hypothetical protein